MLHQLPIHPLDEIIRCADDRVRSEPLASGDCKHQLCGMERIVQIASNSTPADICEWHPIDVNMLHSQYHAMVP